MSIVNDEDERHLRQSGGGQAFRLREVLGPPVSLRTDIDDRPT